jgi:hypothetical protein
MQSVIEKMIGVPADGTRILIVPPPAPDPWTPALLANLRAWYSASTLALSAGASIPSIASGGGITNVAAQGTAGARPLFGYLDSDPDLPYMDFDGVNDALILADRTISNGGSCIVVAALMRFDAFATDTGPKALLTIPTTGASSTRFNFGLEGIAGASKRWAFSGKNTDAGGTVNTVSTAVADTNLHIVIAQFNRGVNPARAKIWIDGTSVYDANSAITGGTWDATDCGSVADGACIGNKFSYATNQGMDAKLLEFVLLDAVISDANRQLIEGWAAWAGKIQGNLPSDHPYKAAAPTI